MNTFLPVADFRACAAILDWRRLNKQITEGIQLCNVILRITGKPLPPEYAIQLQSLVGWHSHPVLKLWSAPDRTFYLRELVEYIDAMACEWTLRPQCKKRHKWFSVGSHYIEADLRIPKQLRWDDEVHKAMVGNLLRKEHEDYVMGKVPSGCNPFHYSEKFLQFDVPFRLNGMQSGYVWRHPCET